MRRSEYCKQLTNEQIRIAVDKAENAAEFLRHLANFVELFSMLGTETVRTRASVRQAKKALDFAEFLEFIRSQSPETAKQLEKTEVVKFDWGRLHIKFLDRNDDYLGWHRNTIEMCAEKLYGVPFKIMVRH